MATNIEIEAKVLINEKEYNRVKSYYKNNVDKEYNQINHYIDTNELSLKKMGIGLRIREKDNLYTLTLKAPLAEGLLEKDEELSFEQFNAFKKNNIFPDSKNADFIRMLGVNPEDLKILTSLTTYRLEINTNDKEGYEFSIDKNTYNNKVDYELEVSGPLLSKAKEILKEICNITNSFYKDNPKSKETRALETLSN